MPWRARRQGCEGFGAIGAAAATKLFCGDARDEYVEGRLGNDRSPAERTTTRSWVRPGPAQLGGGTVFEYLHGSADVFVFNKGDSYDTVWNFSAAEGDKIRLVNEPGRPE